MVLSAEERLKPLFGDLKQIKAEPGTAIVLIVMKYKYKYKYTSQTTSTLVFF